MRTIVVVDYDSTWPQAFEQLRSTIWLALGDVALAVEHVGSTSVPGLAAKPIIDISAVVATRADVSVAIERLATLGYVHRGNLGVENRETFDSPHALPAHHLYVCPSDSLALLNHVKLRDHLRANPTAAKEYGELKRRLAAQFPRDIDRYIDGKTDFILRMLKMAGVPADRREVIARTNRAV